MPRVSKYSTTATPQKAPVRVPLNDDRQEKADRRHALQEQQRNSFRASATPNRRRISLAAGHNSPHTPAQDVDMLDVAGTAVTPMHGVRPLVANFEEWMKMATDNKINATNSWNFALIDYFHEMSLLKEGDGVNFQKASCTLDGCVKIYTSRVDSVATDTGKLLSGLAENVGKKRRGEGDDDAEGEDEDAEEGEDGQKKRRRKKALSEDTLASSFSQLQNKKMELEFSVDPLFKKASADFDEGGAKGLLLNHLAIDGHGRIVFDSSDDANDATPEDSQATPAPEGPSDDRSSEDIEIDVLGLAAKYFPDLTVLDEQDICPSMKTFDLSDVNGSVDMPFLQPPEERNNENEVADDEVGNRSGLYMDDDNAMGFDDDDDDGVHLGVGDEPVAFGEGGEAFAREAMRDPQARVHVMGLGDGGNEGGSEGVEDGVAIDGAQYGISMTHGHDQEQENILSYFDQALRKNWAGPEHWRIRRVKDVGKAAPVTKRKEKEPFKIDFAGPMAQATADALYTPATSKSTISLPKAQWKSKTGNLLPDDKHFNSKQLLRLFLKPKARMGSRRDGRASQQHQAADQPPNGEVDEAYWARQGEAEEENSAQGHYNPDFYEDNELPTVGPIDDDDDFADAQEHQPPLPEGETGALQSLDGAIPSSQEDAYGAQLVTTGRNVRPQYLQYARVAKKVDVKRLKDELWRGIGFEETPRPPQPDEPATKEMDGTLTFTDVVNSLQTVYPKQAMADISTSYCFICLLHLANEKGLVIDNQEHFENLTIRRDFTADLSVGGE
ncbi:barren [Plenodomus tracheiphilus IPT5]|uniref:Condensin complex subunit 2 n=1 Tax=Plenodomus tracheiphilus IPT5 TaxID=1408161 RepID=A0A6A7AMV3_9PLEO|nr:barren [Plenodomus tracheiphilus IPT5]